LAPSPKLNVPPLLVNGVVTQFGRHASPATPNCSVPPSHTISAPSWINPHRPPTAAPKIMLVKATSEPDLTAVMSVLPLLAEASQNPPIETCSPSPNTRPSVVHLHDDGDPVLPTMKITPPDPPVGP